MRPARRRGLYRQRKGADMLSYSAIASLDGYTADADGEFGWAAPDEEVHAFVNDLERRVGTYLYGRRMYEVMRYWENVTLEGWFFVVFDFTGFWLFLFLV